MSYGFDDEDEAIELPKPKIKKAKSVVAPDIKKKIEKTGENLGFVSRTASKRRKPGPRRKEPQDKITLTGPKRVLDLLRQRSEEEGGVPYWQVLEDYLERPEK
jgi:hypothetical protein